jgi:hypothetical protein
VRENRCGLFVDAPFSKIESDEDATKIFLNFRNLVFHPTQISCIDFAVSSHRGALAIVTDAGRDAVDAGGALTNAHALRTAKSCGPDASTLAFKSRGSVREATVTKEPDHRGEHEGNR